VKSCLPSLSKNHMTFEPTDDLRQLADSLRRLAERADAFETRQKTPDGQAGDSTETWERLAELGLLALCLPDAHGGLGGCWRDLLEPMEIIGAALMVEPVVQTLAAAQLLARTASESCCAALLPRVAAGQLKLVLAHQERDARYETCHVATKATASAEGGWLLRGRKCVVRNANDADLLLVSARTSGVIGEAEGISLFLVDAHQPGVIHSLYRTFDQFPAADVEFELTLPDDALVGVAGGASAAINWTLDLETALWCAQACGAMACANTLTLEYLKTRHQFGVPIGSFQVLQHRMVDMTVELELARSMAWFACVRADADVAPGVRARSISAAKLRVGEAARRIAQESVQLHGGIGMTEEMKVSHLFRRLTAFCQQFGDGDFHLDRYTRLAR